MENDPNLTLSEELNETPAAEAAGKQARMLWAKAAQAAASLAEVAGTTENEPDANDVADRKSDLSNAVKEAVAATEAAESTGHSVAEVRIHAAAVKEAAEAATRSLYSAQLAIESIFHNPACPEGPKMKRPLVSKAALFANTPYEINQRLSVVHSTHPLSHSTARNRSGKKAHEG